MTRPGLSSPELHRNCIVCEIGMLSSMLITNVSQNQRAKSERRTVTANDERQKKTAKSAKKSENMRRRRQRQRPGKRRTAHGTRHGMQQAANGKRHTAHDEPRTTNRERQRTNGKRKQRKTAKPATTAKDQRTSNSQRRFDKSVSTSLCRSLSVFKNIVAIFQVHIQQHKHNFAQKVDQRKCAGPSLWRDKKEIDSVSFCQSLSLPFGLNLCTEPHRTNIFRS